MQTICRGKDWNLIRGDEFNAKNLMCTDKAQANFDCLANAQRRVSSLLSQGGQTMEAVMVLCRPKPLLES